MCFLFYSLKSCQPRYYSILKRIKYPNMVYVRVWSYIKISHIRDGFAIAFLVFLPSGKHTIEAIENGPVEIVDLPWFTMIYPLKMGGFSIVFC